MVNRQHKQGDSGGPLVNLARNKLLGIVSFGFSYCGGYTGVPDGFTRVSNFTEWINERIRVPPVILAKTTPDVALNATVNT